MKCQYTTRNKLPALALLVFFAVTYFKSYCIETHQRFNEFFFFKFNEFFFIFSPRILLHTRFIDQSQPFPASLFCFFPSCFYCAAEQQEASWVRGRLLLNLYPFVRHSHPFLSSAPLRRRIRKKSPLLLTTSYFTRGVLRGQPGGCGHPAAPPAAMAATTDDDSATTASSEMTAVLAMFSRQALVTPRWAAVQVSDVNWHNLYLFTFCFPLQATVG